MNRIGLAFVVVFVVGFNSVFSQESDSVRVYVHTITGGPDKGGIDSTVSYYKKNWLIHEKEFVNGFISNELLFRGDTAIEIRYYDQSAQVMSKSFYYVSKDSIKTFNGIDDLILACWQLKSEEFSTRGQIQSRYFYKRFFFENEGFFSCLYYSEEFRRGKLIKQYKYSILEVGLITEEYHRGKLKKCFALNGDGPDSIEVKCKKGRRIVVEN